MGVQTSKAGERTILYVGDTLPPQVKPPERTLDDNLRLSRNTLLGLGGLAAGGNAGVALVKAVEHVPGGDSLGVATRVGLMMAVAGTALETFRQLAKRA